MIAIPNRLHALLYSYRLSSCRVRHAASTHRTVVTTPYEPPPQATERPCSIVLAEDAVYSDPSSSWRSISESRFPEVHGMPFQYFSWPDDPAAATRSDESSSSSSFDMDTALSELSRDLASTSSSTSSQTIFIAHGPWMSWMALFHLESLPLAGLVLVDPLPLDHQNYVIQFELLYQNHKDSMDYKLFQDYMQHWDHWSLQLEPGAVPMLVVSTKARGSWRKAAQATADRHSRGAHGAVPVVELGLLSMDKTRRDSKTAIAGDNDEEYVENVVDVLADWVVDRVL